jgi:uncharacterized protein involved in tolerance to divalent cations
MQYYQTFISAETVEQAEAIRSALLKEKIILGGPILEGPAQFWWKDNIVDMNYVYLLTYTRENLRDEVNNIAETTSREEVCMISHLPFEGNQKFISLLNDTLRS